MRLNWLGAAEGVSVGSCEGEAEGAELGEEDGDALGPAEGAADGAPDGADDGALDGESLGDDDGLELGTDDGDDDGLLLGACEGTALGAPVGLAVVGASVGDAPAQDDVEKRRSRRQWHCVSNKVGSHGAPGRVARVLLVGRDGLCATSIVRKDHTRQGARHSTRGEAGEKEAGEGVGKVCELCA